MKELSIKEKAKRYDEAIERARNHHDRDGLTLEQYETIDIIFPELKESEDEKIRKKVIATIHLYYGEPLEDEAKEMIAWLEKQGGRDEEILILKDQIESLHAAIKALKEVHKIELDKQGEPHSAWSEKGERIYRSYYIL